MYRKLLTSLLSLAVTEAWAADQPTKTLDTIEVRSPYLEIYRLKPTKEIMVLRPKDFAQNGTRTISDALSQLPDVTVGATGYGEIDIRGQGVDEAAHNIQVLVDGAPVTTLTNHPLHTDYDLVPIESVERIEVIPGGGAVMYGSGSSGGVINITSRLVDLRKPETSLSMERNSKGWRGNINLGQNFLDNRLGIEANYNHSNRNLYFDNTYRNSEYAALGIRWSPSSGQQYVLRVSHLQEDSQYVNNISKKNFETYGRHYIPKMRKQKVGLTPDGRPIEVSKPGYIYGDRRFDQVSLSQRLDITKSVSWRNDVFFNNGYFMGGDSEARRMNHQDIGIRSKLSFEYAPKNTLTLGVDVISQKAELSYDDYKYVKRNTYKLNPKYFSYNKHIYAGYLLNTSRWKSFDFTQGIRYELAQWRFEKTAAQKSKIDDNGQGLKNFYNFAWELSAGWRYRQTGRLYGRYERGYTLPDGIQISDQIINAKKEKEYIPTSAEAATFNNFEIGISDSWDWLDASLVGWYSETKNQIRRPYQRTKNGLETLSLNLLNTRRWGLDVKLRQNFGRVELEESYSFTTGKIRCTDQALCDQVKLRSDFASWGIQKVPRHKLTLRASVEIINDLKASARYTYQGKYINYLTNNNHKDDYVDSHGVLDLDVQYRPNNHIELWAGITNVFNKEYFTYGSGNPSSLTFVPAPTRAYFAGVKLKY